VRDGLGVLVMVGVFEGPAVRDGVDVRVGVATPTLVTYCEATQPFVEPKRTGIQKYPPADWPVPVTSSRSPDASVTMTENPVPGPERM
jgi:hypothetical protein